MNFRGILSLSFFEELISFLRFSGGKTGKRATCAFDWLQSATDPLFFSFDARASPPPSRKNRREKEKGREREKNRKKKKERAFANKSSRDSNTNGKINLRKKIPGGQHIHIRICFSLQGGDARTMERTLRKSSLLILLLSLLLAVSTIYDSLVINSSLSLC